PDGTYHLRARVTDAAGNEGASAVRTTVVDTTALTVTLIAPSLTNDATPSVTVTAAEARKTAVKRELDLNNDGGFLDPGETGHTTATLTGGTATFDVTPALSPDGIFHLRARITDAAGNQGTSAVRTVIVDTTAPVVTLTAPALTNDTTPSVTVTAA